MGVPLPTSRATRSFPAFRRPSCARPPTASANSRCSNWGFVLLQKEKAPKRVTNIRDDKAQTKFWKPSFEQRRCLVPASSYCEPKGEKPATWHWFSINGDDARPVFAFPGVWTEVFQLPREQTLIVGSRIELKPLQVGVSAETPAVWLEVYGDPGSSESSRGEDVVWPHRSQGAVPRNRNDVTSWRL